MSGRRIFYEGISSPETAHLGDQRYFASTIDQGKAPFLVFRQACILSCLVPFLLLACQLASTSVMPVEIGKEVFVDNLHQPIDEQTFQVLFPTDTGSKLRSEINFIMRNEYICLRFMQPAWLFASASYVGSTLSSYIAAPGVRLPHLITSYTSSRLM